MANELVLGVSLGDARGDAGVGASCRHLVGRHANASGLLRPSIPRLLQLLPVERSTVQ